MESNSNQQDQKNAKTDRLDKFAAYKGFNDNKITWSVRIAVGDARQIQKRVAKTLRAHLRVRKLPLFRNSTGNALIYGEGDMLVGTKAKTVSSYPEYPFINDTKAECGLSSGRLIQRLSTISPYAFVSRHPGRH